MSVYKLSKRAGADIAAIWNHSYQHWGAEQAGRYYRALIATIESAASMPEMGRAIHDVRANYRMLRSGSHIVFYVISVRGIEVRRILHRRMVMDQNL